MGILHPQQGMINIYSSLEEDILDVVNETPGLSIQGLSCSASGSNNSAVQILISPPLRYIFTDEARFTKDRIQNISICGQMRFFHHITNSGSTTGQYLG
jgi:hypothetical protein